MKGKIQFRFCMPQVQRFRSRVENPSKDLSTELRNLLQEVVCEVLNGQQLTIRAKFIEKVNQMGLKFKSPAHEAKVMSVVESFFDAVFAPTPEALDALVGDDNDDAPESADDSAAEPEKKKAPKKSPKKADPDDFES